MASSPTPSGITGRESSPTFKTVVLVCAPVAPSRDTCALGIPALGIRVWNWQASACVSGLHAQHRTFQAMSSRGWEFRSHEYRSIFKERMVRSVAISRSLPSPDPPKNSHFNLHPTPSASDNPQKFISRPLHDPGFRPASPVASRREGRCDHNRARRYCAFNPPPSSFPFAGTNHSPSGRASVRRRHSR